MNKTFLTAVILVFILPLAYAEDFSYVGRWPCWTCHYGIKKGLVYEKWAESPHARTFETLKAVGQEKNPQCLQCHTTGFNAGGYQVGDLDGSTFEGVGCESCHGPGSGYKPISIMKDKKKCLEYGLIEPTEEVCKKCHNKKSPTFKGFNYKEFVAKIDHKYRK
jgi:hypothetical protein